MAANGLITDVTPTHPQPLPHAEVAARFGAKPLIAVGWAAHGNGFYTGPQLLEKHDVAGLLKRSAVHMRRSQGNPWERVVTRRLCALLLVASPLAACGGGGDSSTTPIVVSSPTPTPTASPTAGDGYTPYANLTGDRSFDLLCQSMTSASGEVAEPGPASLLVTDSGLRLDYAEETQTYTITYPAPVIFNVEEGESISFDRSDSSSPTLDSYSKDINGSPAILNILQPAPLGSSDVYTRILYTRYRNVFTGNTDTNHCVLGLPTRLDDPLPQADLSYTGFYLWGALNRIDDLGNITGYSLYAQNMALSVDGSSNSLTLVSMSFDLKGNRTFGSGPGTIDLGTFSGSTTFPPDLAGYGGQLDNGDASLESPFYGWFFGPQGIEAGVTINLYGDAPGVTTRGYAVMTASR